MGGYLWRHRSRPRTFKARWEAFVFPVTLFYFMVSFAIPASGGVRALLLLPLAPMLGWLIWMAYRDIKATKIASEAFVNDPSVRKNGEKVTT